MSNLTKQRSIDDNTKKILGSPAVQYLQYTNRTFQTDLLEINDQLKELHHT